MTYYNAFHCALTMHCSTALCPIFGAGIYAHDKQSATYYSILALRHALHALSYVAPRNLDVHIVADLDIDLNKYFSLASPLMPIPQNSSKVSPILGSDDEQVDESDDDIVVIDTSSDREKKSTTAPDAAPVVTGKTTVEPVKDIDLDFFDDF